jgi:DNA polymerase-3 subunit delta'
LQHSEYKYYRWHELQWQQLWSRAHLPHALLLTGAEGVGKSAFALAVAARLLCPAATETGACGRCEACRWLAAGNHPDISYVIPDSDVDSEAAPAEGDKKKGRRQIVIGQIRALSDFVFVGAHRGGARVVIIDPASAMNASAANSLLKILEEPPAGVYFILVSRSELHVLPTVRSRCRVFKLPKPSPAEAAAWISTNHGASAVDVLDFAGGAPLLAASLAADDRGRAIEMMLSAFAKPDSSPTDLAGRWEKTLQGNDESSLRMEDLVVALQKWLVGLTLLKTAGRQRFLGKFASAAEQLVRKASASGLLRCYNDLLKIRALASHPLNTRLMLEDLAERYLRALASDRR